MGLIFLSFFLFWWKLCPSEKADAGTGSAAEARGGVKGIRGWGAAVQSAGNRGRQGGVSMGVLPPPPPLSRSPNRTAAPYHPAWGETNTGSSFGMGDFPWISPGCVDKQTDTLIEFEREGKRERKRRGRGAIVDERRSVSGLTCRGRADV